MVRFACSWITTDLERLATGDVLGDRFTPEMDLCDLLQDLELPDAPEFDHWRDRVRARWRPTIQSAMLQLLHRARRGGNWRELDRLADRLFELDELSEQGVRAKMEAAAIAGDRFGALHLYEEWKSRLQVELSALPSPVMYRFAENLRRGNQVVRQSQPERKTSATLAPLVARTEEFRSLYEVWERVLERRACHALLRGEQGVGKTTLLSHFLAAVALDGAAVSRAKCFELEQDIPYAALSMLLRGLVEQPGAAATSPEALADLALIVPSLRQRFPGLPESLPAQGESARLRLTEAAFQLLVAVAEERPVILAVDDFHLADDASLAVLHLVMRRLEDERVMIVLVGRGREAARSPNVGRLLDAVTSLGAYIVDVRPLGDEASDELLSVLLGVARPHPATRRAMLHAARGYPLALALLVHDWPEGATLTGALLLEGMTPDIAPGTAGTLFAPLLARVHQCLEARARPVLDLAAVLGSRMNDLRFYSTLGLSSAETIAALDVLVDHGILHEGDTGLEFVNDIARTQVYLQQPAAIRREMHALVADALLLKEREAGAVSGLELAWHLIRCGRLAEGVTYMLRGAREAIDHGAAWEAERALRSGADALQGEEALVARLLLAESLFEQGRECETREILIVAESTDLGWARDVANAIGTAALARRPDQPMDQALDAFHHLTRIVREGRNDRARAVAARGAALFALKLGSQGVADELLQATEDVSDADLSPIDIADLRYARATALYQLRRLDGSEREAVRAIAALERANLRNATLLSLYCGLGAIRCARGEYNDAVPLLETAHGIAHKIGNLATARACLSNLSLCCFRLGDNLGHIRWGEMASRRHPEAPDTFAETTYAYHLAIGYALTGEAQRAFDALAVGDAAAGRLAPAWARQSWLLSRADVLALLGRHQDATRAAREATSEELTGLLSDSRAGAYARWKARLVRDQEEAKSARVEVLGLLTRGERIDAADRAEILAAAKLLGQLTNDDVTNEGQALLQALSQLPSAVETLLRRLGFLDVVKPLGAARRTRRRKRSGGTPAEDLAVRQSQTPIRLE